MTWFEERKKPENPSKINFARTTVNNAHMLGEGLLSWWASVLPPPPPPFHYTVLSFPWCFPDIVFGQSLSEHLCVSEKSSVLERPFPVLQFIAHTNQSPTTTTTAFAQHFKFSSSLCETFLVLLHVSSGINRFWQIVFTCCQVKPNLDFIPQRTMRRLRCSK